MAIVALVTPFLYNQISRSTNNIRDMSIAQNIISLRDDVLNFVRLNIDKWPDVAQIRLSDDELDNISEMPMSGFIDKYIVSNATITDVYLAFELDSDLLRVNQVARHIGDAAAVVSDDGVAYGNNWAVSAPDFRPGDLIYRVSRDVVNEDKTKFLHRTATDGLNTMLRDLNMGGNNIYNVGGISAKSANIQNAVSVFVTSDVLASDNIYFSHGASLDDAVTDIGTLRVTGDISGFRNIYADKMNGTQYTTSGRIITDKANVLNSVNVSRNLVLKSDTLRTISGFTAISANSVLVPYVSCEEILFYENFGLTVSGELLMSTTPPLKIGSWVFPSYNMPRFSSLDLDRGKIPAMPQRNEFSALLESGWQSTPQREVLR